MLGHLALARGRTADAAGQFDDARAAAVRTALTALDPAADAPNVSAPLDLHNALHTHIRLYGLGLLAARAGDMPAVAGSAELLAELDVPRWAAAANARHGNSRSSLPRAGSRRGAARAAPPSGPAPAVRGASTQDPLPD